jgi:cyclophilin family peptidyl-prolyl cis-trans isomerase
LNTQICRKSVVIAHPLLFAGLLAIVLLVAACGAPATESAAPTMAPATDTPVGAPPPATDTPTPADTPVPVEAAPPASSGEDVPPPDDVSAGAASELAPEARADMYDEAPTMQIDPAKYYYATFKTQRGDIRVQLFADRAPNTVNNFVFLAREGFYNDTQFHRVLDGFMAQGGDPTGTGAGGPGYRFADEFDPSLGFDRPGLLAMANSGPATNGSQFFITFAPTEWLNQRHTIFGEVISGQDVLDKLTRRDPNTGPTYEGDKLYTVLIEELEGSELPTPPPPTPLPTPFAPSSVDGADRPLAAIEPAARAGYFNLAPELVIDPTKTYSATIQTTQGDLIVELYADKAPVSVNNFVVLANLGFFDGLPVNTNDPNNALLFGSPDNNPQHDVGYQIEAEVNLTGTLAIGSMAYVPFRLPTGDIGTSGSLILIARIAPPPQTNAQFSFFGKIVDGLEVLEILTPEDTIERVTIAESD